MSVELLGFNIDNYSFDEAVVRAKNMIDGHKVSQVVTINPEMCGGRKQCRFCKYYKRSRNGNSGRYRS